MQFTAFALTCLLFVTAPKADRGDTKPMPLTLSGNSPSSYPVWIDQRAVLDPDGTVNKKLLHPAFSRAVDELLATPPENGCILAPALSVSRIDLQPRESIEQATDTAQTVLIPRVTGASFGFYVGEAGQLLRLTPTTVFKGGSGRQVYYTFIPVGEFTVGDKRICKYDARFPQPPQIGAEVVTFAHFPDDAILDLNDPGDIVTVNKDGSLSLPENYSAKHLAADGRAPITPDRAALIHQIQSRVSERGPQ